MPSVVEHAIPGGWSEREVLVGHRRFRLLLPARPEEFLNQLEREGHHEVEPDPYWTELWPTSKYMAEWVLRQNWGRGTRALELGCGLGLVGLAALAAGLEVTFSDRHALAVQTAAENATRNGFSSTDDRVVDWRCRPRMERFPLIFASDVLYDKALHLPLIKTIEALLSPGGTSWIADPGRSTTSEFRAVGASRGIYFEYVGESDETESTPFWKLLRWTASSRQV